MPILLVALILGSLGTLPIVLLVTKRGAIACTAHLHRALVSVARAVPAVLLALTLLAGFSLPGLATVPGAPNPAQDPRWTQFTQQEDGLASNSLWAILPDQDRLWFGGEAGVSSFDGAWTNHEAAPDTDPAQQASALPAQTGTVFVLARGADPESTWAGTEEGQLLRWSAQGWTLALNLSSPILALLPRADEVWIGTRDGLYRFAGLQLQLVDALGRQPVFALVQDGATVWAGTEGGLWRNRADRWARISVGEMGFEGGIYAVIVDQTGALVVGTPYGVGWRPRDGADWQWIETSDELGEPAPVQALAQDQAGIVWAGTDGAGAFALQLANRAISHLGFTGDPNLTTRFVRDIAVDQDGSVWFATPVGAFRYQVQMWIADVQGDSVEDQRNYINDLLVDQSGALWIATGGGGVRYRGTPEGAERLYTSADGATDTALALAEDSHHAIWAGGFDGLFRFSDGHWTAPIAVANLPDPTVTALLAEDAWLWIGTEGGLARLHMTTGALDQIAHLAGQSVEALAIDSLGRLWVGTLGDGVWLRQTPDGWRQLVHEFDDPTALPGDSIGGSGLAADPATAGGMWTIVLKEGLVRWNGRTWRTDDHAAHLPSSLLWTAYSDPSDGSLWVGSEAGVTRFDGLTWGTLSIQDGLQSAVTYAVARSAQGGYWLGGRTGLTHFQPDSSPPWVRIGELTGRVELRDDGAYQATVGDDVIVNYTAGDLQTDRPKLVVLCRLLGPTQTGLWLPLEEAFMALRFDQPGDYTLELMARDQSFNYSEPAALSLTVIDPPVVVNLPWLGPVETSVFQLLLVLGTIALVGSTYIAMEIVHDRRRVQEAVERGFNPYISGEPVRRDEMFFARRDLVQRIVDTLHHNSIMIHGERRIGKTSLLLQLTSVLREVDDADYWFVPIYIDLEGTPQETFFHFLMDEILAGLRNLDGADREILPLVERLGVATTDAADYSDRSLNRDLDRIAQVLEAYGARHKPGKHVRVILLMDEMDVMSRYDSLVQQQLRRIFMREFAATLGAVVAGIQINKDWDRVESPWFNLFNEIALTPFTREQAVELLTEPVLGYYSYEPAAIDFILEHAQGRPYRVQQYGLEAVNHMLSEGRRRIRLVDAEIAEARIQVAELQQQAGTQAKAPVPHAHIPHAVPRSVARSAAPERD